MPQVLDVDLGPDVAGWFTGRGTGPEPPVGRAGNLSARRPHQPVRLATDRRAAFDRHGARAEDVHLMHQVHGAHVARLSADHGPGYVPAHTDGMVTTVAGRALAVLTADCVPVLLAGPGVVAVAHVGRRGLVDGVVQATLDACVEAGSPASALRAVLGPAIHGCCYEVPAGMQQEVGAVHPEAVASTTWGTPGLDLPSATAAVLRSRGVQVDVVEACTRCDSHRWFSHRADPGSGRQAGVVVRPGSAGAP